MLNHSRRAPPPAPLIRLINSDGEEGETDLDSRSASSSSASSSPGEPDSASTSDSELSESFDEYPIALLTKEKASTSSSSSSTLPSCCPSEKPYYQMRMKWLKGSTLSKQDNLPMSASSISEFVIPSPQDSSSLFLEEKEDENSRRCRFRDNQNNIEEQDSKSVIDWLVKLTDSTFKDDGEVLLFFQSEQEPGQQTITEAQD